MHKHTKSLAMSALTKLTKKNIGCASCAYLKSDKKESHCSRTIFVFPCGTAFYNTTDHEVYRGGRCGTNYTKYIRK